MQHDRIHVRMTSDFPESVCLSSLRGPIYCLKGEPQKVRNHYFQNKFFSKLITKVTMAQIYDSTISFLDLLRLEGKALAAYFGPKGFMGNVVISSAVLGT